jgi:hypothetical protein
VNLSCNKFYLIYPEVVLSHRGSDLTADVMVTLLGKLNPDLSSVGFVILSSAYALICSDEALRSRLLRELHTLDDINVAVLQRGEMSRGVPIPRRCGRRPGWCEHRPHLW